MVVIRAGQGATEVGTAGSGYRAAAVARLLRFEDDKAVVQRINCRLGSFFRRWAKPVRVPAANVLRDATAREIALGFPVP